MIANLSQKFNTRATAIALSSILLISEVYFYDLPILSSIAFLAYVITLGKGIGERISEDKKLQWWSGIAILLCTISLIGVLAYYPYKLTPEISLISIFAPLLFLFKKKKNLLSVVQTHCNASQLHSNASQPHSNASLLFFFFALEMLLLGTIIVARNGELMQSPWMAIPSWFFILFAVSTTLLVYLLAKKTSARIMLIGTVIHFFIFYCITAIVYKLGFGFDGFIHRATESWILQNGFINPKEPFYIGQYGFVVTLSRITGIAIKYIDIFLVPILASISIPTLMYVVLPKAWNITKQTALALALCVPFIFYLSFNLTTPHNIVLLLAVLTSIALVGYCYRTTPFIVPTILALTALGTHPLLGLPLIIITGTAGILQHAKKKSLHILVYIGLVTILPLIPATMFGARLWLQGNGIPEVLNPIGYLAKFIQLFERPYWYSPHSTLSLEILYFWQVCITPLIIIFSIIGAWLLRKQKILPTLLLVSAFGLTMGAFLLRSWVVFPGVSSHEQGNYPLRLLIGAIALLSPLALYGIYQTSKTGFEILKTKFPTQTHVVYAVGAIIAGTLLMIFLYLSYPQYNKKVSFPGFNVTEYDKKTVKWIHDQNNEYNYVVLSSILTAVTSLTEYPFAHYVDTEKGSQFYYSIPAGGSLYVLYEEMLYEGQRRETIDKVFKLTDAHKVYFVVSWYWKNSDKIVAGAKKTATHWQSIDDKIWVFEYIKTGN